MGYKTTKNVHQKASKTLVYTCSRDFFFEKLVFHFKPSEASFFLGDVSCLMAVGKSKMVVGKSQREHLGGKTPGVLKIPLKLFDFPTKFQVFLVKSNHQAKKRKFLFSDRVKFCRNWMQNSRGQGSLIWA